MKSLLIALLLIAPALQAEAPSITVVPAAAEVNQVVTFVTESTSSSIWSLSGGEWCLYRDCFWRSNDDLIAGTGAGDHPLWRASAAGSYTITLTPPTGSAVTVTVVVTEP